MTDRHPVVVAARRTPIGTVGRSLATIGVDRLAAVTLRATVDDLGPVAPHADSAGDVDDVIIGNCMGPGGNIARVAALAAGLGLDVPGVTLDRQCGSGLAAILQAGQAIRSGDAAVVLAGGAESASTAPIRTHRDGTTYARAAFAPAEFGDPDMGEAAEELAAQCRITRERQDAHAAASHAKALAARDAGRFDAELVPVAGLAADDRPRPLRPEVLARMPAAFAPGGTVTAGNACAVSDGAAAVAMVSEEHRAGRPGLRLIAGAVTGCDPRRPGWGPVPAVQRVLNRSDVSISEVAAVEIVEAFAGQVLAVTDGLELDADAESAPAVCADGGALALGHPWGASGAVVVVRLFSRLVRENAPDGTLGLATAAVGGGMGVAALFSVVR